MRIQPMRVANNSVTQSDFNFLTSIISLCLFSNITRPHPTFACVFYMTTVKTSFFQRQSMKYGFTHLFTIMVKRSPKSTTNKLDSALTKWSWPPSALSPRIFEQLFIKKNLYPDKIIYCRFNCSPSQPFYE